MIDRRNRGALVVLGLLLAVGGGLSAALGTAAFGAAHANRDVVDSTVIRWWNEGGWESFAVVTAIGVVLFLVGGWLCAGQLRREDGHRRTPTVTFPANGSRGETTLRSSALSHTLQADLGSIPQVTRAAVGLFGEYPAIELRAGLTVTDSVDLEELPARVGDALQRVETTTGVRLDPVQVTLRFTETARDRSVA